MNIRFTISWKIGVGFGIFIVIVAVVFLLTRGTLNQTKIIGEEVNQVYTPSIKALENLGESISYSHVLIKHWSTVQSRPQEPEKLELIRICETTIPAQLQTLETLSEEWEESEVVKKDSLINAIAHLNIVYDEIRRELNSFNSYDDPIVRMNVDFYFLTGESIPKLTSLIKRLHRELTETHRGHLDTATARMNSLGDQLRFFVGTIAILVLIFGIIIAFLVSKSIVAPISELKRTLLYLGKGVYPQRSVKVSKDEIGDMAFAVNRLVDGLKKTREFSNKVGKGDFNAHYTPLSEDDELGHALLKMRDELAVSERILEKKVEERTNEVVRQKEMIEKQKEQVTQLYNDLTDSINYAKRLQQAILPTEDLILDMFPESFVLYKPRDIVSGDFYWFRQFGNIKLVAAVDCTGHGVPGAFMSLVGHNVLSQVTKVFTEPSKILNNLNRLSTEAFNQGSNTITDGMDLSMISVNTDTLLLEYAGAYNSIYIIRDKELFQLKADKFAIGSFAYGEKVYNSHQFQLEPDDNIYMFTDGYSDQFGGERGKKFMSKRFRELLISISEKPMDEQNDILNQTLVTWKGNNFQVDDVLVIGLKV